MKEQLADIPVAGFEGGIASQLGAVETRDASISIASPEKLLGVIECKSCNSWRAGLCFGGWKEQAPNLRQGRVSI